MKMHTPGKVMKIKSEEEHPNGMIYENEVGYHIKSEVYANKSSDINELYEIARSIRKIKEV